VHAFQVEITHPAFRHHVFNLVWHPGRSLPYRTLRRAAVKLIMNTENMI
jgi:hypothetical protein